MASGFRITVEAFFVADGGIEGGVGAADQAAGKFYLRARRSTHQCKTSTYRHLLSSTHLVGLIRVALGLLCLDLLVECGDLGILVVCLLLECGDLCYLSLEFGVIVAEEVEPLLDAHGYGSNDYDSGQYAE